MRVLALDLAKNRSGLAIWDGLKLVTWNLGKSTPIDIFEHIKGILLEGDVVIIEEHVHFRNGRTTRTLIELNGFVYWSLSSLGYQVQKLFPYRARKAMSDQYQNIPDDERDAALLIHEYLGIFEPLQIERKSDDVSPNLFRKRSSRRTASRSTVLDCAS